MGIEALDDQHRTVIVGSRAILLKADIHAKRTPSNLALVVERRDCAIIYVFLF